MFDAQISESELVTVKDEFAPDAQVEPAAEPESEVAVEVWCSYSQRWVQGFRLHETLSDGKLVLLGRDSEAVLPAAFDPRSVRFAGAEQSNLCLIS